MMEKASPIELGTKNIWPLLIQYAVPSVIAMTSSSVYNITGSIFIGQGVGAMAIAGLAVTFPLMNLGAAFGSLVGVGASTLMSLRLGQKDYESANSILGNVFVLNLIIGLAYTVLIMAFMNPILYFFGASEHSLPYARDYMVVITLGNVITHMYLGLNALLRATGKPKVSMYTTLSSVVINIILTAVFIYVFEWGIRGAALATVISQFLMLIWQIRIFSDTREFIHLQKDTFKLKAKIVKNSLVIGLSPFLMNSATSLVVVFVNRQLSAQGGDMAIGAYGIINRFVTLFPMIVMGLNQGMQPIVGYNYGAGHLDRVKNVLKKTIFLATCVMTLGFLVGKLIPEQIAALFTRDSELIRISAAGLQLVISFFPFVGFQMVVANFFQSIGKAGAAIFLSLTRQFLFLLPLLLILPEYFGVSGVWYSMRTADLLAFCVSLVFLIIQYRISSRKNQALN
ncbi:MAG TPA: MATE family efflux transporter [Marinilabiliaceae bacterium]|nr:MATE family efflux transporter [Marinilabiliaceae bacterium]